jgi:3-methyladenine DNA glycosylase AlkD
MAHRRLVRTVREGLAHHADPVRAAGMQAYMKSAMPYRGVQTPLQRVIFRAAFDAHELGDSEAWHDTLLALWRGARFREERYAAIALAGCCRYAPFQTLQTLPLYDELIVTGAWWDYVDAIATQRIGGLLARFPGRMKPLLRRWSRDANPWRRRAAILAQITFKQRTDTALLFDGIEPNLGDREFFIRKAIGWALRQYAWTDPDAIRAYVARHEGELSALSRREALKNIASMSGSKGTMPPSQARPRPHGRRSA